MGIQGENVRNGQREYLDGSLAYEILIPVLVAAMPMIGLIVTKRFELTGRKIDHASESRARIYQRIEKVEERIGKLEMAHERLEGRINGFNKK